MATVLKEKIGNMKWKTTKLQREEGEIDWSGEAKWKKRERERDL